MTDVRDFVRQLQDMGVDTKAHFDDAFRLHPVVLSRPAPEALTIHLELVPESLDEEDRTNLLTLLAKHLPTQQSRGVAGTGAV